MHLKHQMRLSLKLLYDIIANFYGKIALLMIFLTIIRLKALIFRSIMLLEDLF
jgi:hypothetical protein